MSRSEIQLWQMGFSIAEVHNAHRIEMRGDSIRKKCKSEEPAGKVPAGGA